MFMCLMGIYLDSEFQAGESFVLLYYSLIRYNLIF